MLRDINSVKTQITQFFQSKDPNVILSFSGDQPLVLDVRLAQGEREGSFQLQNKFFTKKGDWNELLEKLAIYWDNDFPNKAPIRIIPSP